LITLRFCKFLLVRKSSPPSFQADHAGSIPVGRSRQFNVPAAHGDSPIEAGVSQYVEE
jgi:hypothetical protein